MGEVLQILFLVCSYFVVVQPLIRKGKVLDRQIKREVRRRASQRDGVDTGGGIPRN